MFKDLNIKYSKGHDSFSRRFKGCGSSFLLCRSMKVSVSSIPCSTIWKSMDTTCGRWCQDLRIRQPAACCNWTQSSSKPGLTMRNCHPFFSLFNPSADDSHIFLNREQAGKIALIDGILVLDTSCF